jgi:hypothetical protein
MTETAPTTPPPASSPASSPYGKGHIPSTDASKARAGARSTLHLFGAPPPRLPRSAMGLGDFLPAVRDQLNTSRCTGFGFVGLCATRLAAQSQGRVREVFSANAAYTLGRDYEKAKGQPLQDDGAMPVDLANAASKFGLVLESVWPSAVDTVNTELPVDALEAAVAWGAPTVHLIDSNGTSREVAIRQSLAAGYPVGIGTYVGPKFEQWNGQGVMSADKSRGGGGHFTFLWGYDTYSTPKGDQVVYFGLNSWGASWGWRGMYRVDSSFIVDPRASDFIAGQVVPMPAPKAKDAPKS